MSQYTNADIWTKSDTRLQRFISYKHCYVWDLDIIEPHPLIDNDVPCTVVADLSFIIPLS